MLCGGLRRTSSASSVQAPDHAALQTYTGRFATQWGVLDVVALGGQLYMLDPTLADPVADASRLAVVEADTVRVEDAPGYASPGERFVYERNPDGTIRSVRVGSGNTAVPFDAFRASMADRPGIRLGDPVSPPSP